MRKLFAFTLAETLIVMGIIGVVAALTLPNLNSSTGDKEKVAKVKKIYSNLEDAYGRATAIYGPVENWADNNGDVSAQKYGERFTEFMRVSKSCGNGEGCFSKNGDMGGLGDNSSYYKYILSDGTSIAFDYGYPYGYIWIDIDGPNKGSAEIGKDIFQFYISQGNQKGQLFPWGGDTDTFSGEDDCPKSKVEGCTAWIIKHGNMDYLKTDSSGKCKNNTSIVLDGVSNITCK
ncbi:type II secretion system protein [bacterium]|nr:type II secretion system protein [bacterium]